jgi:hypothetical protein
MHELPNLGFIHRLLLICLHDMQKDGLGIKPSEHVSSYLFHVYANNTRGGPCSHAGGLGRPPHT